MKNKYHLTAIALAGVMCFNAALAGAVGTSAKSKSKRARLHIVKAPSRSLAAVKIKNVQFAFNREAIPEDYYAQLDKVAKLMIDNNASLKVSGYADNRGAYVYNWMLSERRAKAVKAYLASKGADTSRIATTEFGYTHPVASNKTASGRQKNRRVELKFAE